MVTTVADPIFIDTNVLVYASRPAAPEHASSRKALDRLEAQDCRLWISTQVLREYLSVVTRPQAAAPGLTMATAIADIRRFQSLFEVANDDDLVVERLLQLLIAYPGSGKQVHDANLVATMLVHGVTRLLTYNARDFQRFAAVIELEPLGLP
jgi:predicted nucleic acid-binding protein